MINRGNVARCFHVSLVACIAVLCRDAPTLSAADAREEFFATKVVPLLEDKCLSCHSHLARTTEGGLTLDSKSGWERGGDRGRAVVPTEPEQSPLVKAIRYDRRLTDVRGHVITDIMA